MTDRRHIVRRLMLAIALGLVTTITIAWWLSLRGQQSFTYTHVVSINIRPEGVRSYLDACRVTDEYRPGFRRIEILKMGTPINALIWSRVDAELEGTDLTPGYGSGMMPSQPAQRPRLFAWVPRPSDALGTIDAASGRACGWPWLCLYSTRVRDTGAASDHVRGAVSLLAPGAYTGTSSSDPECGSVPVLPIWSGLALNVSLCSLAWGFAIFCGFWLRHMRRRRAFECVKCGYNLRGLPPTTPCPECGTRETSADVGQNVKPENPA